MELPREATDAADGPLVSIVVPAYQVEDYLERCLDSILAQTHANLEVICVDDASTDRSGEILEAYAARDPRVRVIHHEENQGPGPARNTGLEVAKGDYLAMVDADDFIDPEFVETLVTLAEETGADAAISNFRFKLGPFSVPYPIMPLPRHGPGHRAARMALQLLPMPPFAWTKLYRREWFDAHHLEFPPIYYEDLATTVPALSRTTTVAATPRHLYAYCVRSTGITGDFGVRNIVDYLSAADMVRRFLHAHDPWDGWMRAYRRMLFFATWQLTAQILVQDNRIRVRDRLGLIRVMRQEFRRLREAPRDGEAWTSVIDPGAYAERLRRRDRAARRRARLPR